MKRFALTKPAERDLQQIKTYLVEGARSPHRAPDDADSDFIKSGWKPSWHGHVREDLTSRPVKFWPIYSYLIVYESRDQTSSDHPGVARYARCRRCSEPVTITL